MTRLTVLSLFVYINLTSILAQPDRQHATSIIEGILDKYYTDSVFTYQAEMYTFNTLEKDEAHYYDVLSSLNDKNKAGWDTKLVQFTSEARDSIYLTILQFENEFYANFEGYDYVMVSNEYSSLPKGGYFSAKVYIVPVSTVLNNLKENIDSYTVVTSKQVNPYPVNIVINNSNEIVLIREEKRNEVVGTVLIGVDTSSFEILWHVNISTMSKDLDSWQFGVKNTYRYLNTLAPKDTLNNKRHYYLNYNAENIVVLNSGRDQPNRRRTLDTIPFSIEQLLSLEYVDIQNEPQSLVFDKEWTIIDFWYASCLPCIKSLFQLNKAFNDSDLSKVNLWAVNFKDKDPNVLNTLYNRGIEIPALLLNTNQVKDFRIPAYPLLIIVDSEGNVVYSKYGYKEDMTEEIMSIIKAR